MTKVRVFCHFQGPVWCWSGWASKFFPVVLTEDGDYTPVRFIPKTAH